MDVVTHLGRPKTPPSRGVQFLVGAEMKKYDSVDNLMDRIDVELGQLQIRDRFPRSTFRTRSLTRGYDKRKPRKWCRFAKLRSLSKTRESSCSDSGLAISCTSAATELGVESLRPDSRSRLDDSVSSTNYDRNCGSWQHDKKNTEHLNSKSPEAHFLPPTTKHMNAHLSSYSSGDLKLRDLLGAPIATPDCEELGLADGASVQSVDTPRTEDFEEAFQANIVKQTSAQAPPAEIVTTDYIRQKIQQAAPGIEDIISTVGADTLDEMSDLDRSKNRSTHQSNRGQGPNYDASSESELDRDMAKEIREESIRIQKEIELERKANRIRDTTPKSSSSIVRTPKSRERTPNGRDVTSTQSTPSSRYATGSNTGTLTNGSNLSQMSAPSLTSSQERNGAEPTQDADMIQRLNNEKLRLLEEISTLQSKMRSIEQDLSTTERQAKDTRVRAEEARSQLMLAEFKKDSALKEFTELSSELERGRHLQATIQREEAQRNQAANLPANAASFGLSNAELSDLLSERNQLRAIVESRNSSVQLEKAELERQLEATKQELFSDQKANRERVAALDSKVDELTTQLSHVTTEKETKALELDSFRAKNHKLEQNIRELEKSKMEAIMVRDKEIEVLKETTQRDAIEMKMTLNSEVSNANRLLKIAEEKCMKLQVEMQHKDVLNQDLREECKLLQSKTADEEDAHDQLIRETNRKITALHEQKAAEMEVLKSQMEIENLNIVETTTAELQRQHEELIASLKEDYDSQLNQQQHLLNGKEEEICLLRSRLTQQEEAGRKLAERLKADTQLQLEQAIQNERYMWEKEHRHVEGATLKQVKEESDKQLETLKEQVDIEQRRCRQLDDQYRALKAELEEQRHQNQKLYEEKLAAVHKSKQAAQEDTNLQLEKIRQQLEEDTERVLDKLKTELDQKEDEIRSLRNECTDLQQKDADTAIALEKLEKLVVSEINDECRKTAHLLGVTPRKAQGAGFHRSGSPSRSSKHRRSRSITTSAMANLRACNEELRNTVKELKEDVEALKSALYKSKKAKETELEEIRKQMTRDKSHDMDDLRVRLTQIVSTQQSVLDLLDLSASNLLEPDAQSTDVESDNSESTYDSSEHKEQVDHLCTMVLEQDKLSKMLQNREQELTDIQRNMSSWKDETANKMADKFTDELYNQLQVYLSRLERKLTDKTLRRSLRDTADKSRSVGREYKRDLDVEDLGASPPLRNNVQSRIKQLRHRSASAHRPTSTSTPDLSRTVGRHADASASAMEQRVKLAELKAHLAEERAARNQALLNHKLQEVNQLQHTLNSQTKEIISLERSFEDLKHGSYSPPGLAAHRGVIP